MNHSCLHPWLFDAVLSATFLALLTVTSPVQAVDLTMTSAPSITGSGPTLSARYSNVATVLGIDIDLVGTVTYQSNSDENLLEQDGDDARWVFPEGVPGTTETTTVLWSFFESGTTNPVTLSDFNITIDDLDDFEERLESVSTPNATGYSLNSPSNVVASISNGTLTATGGADQNTGDPEGAVIFHFESRSSFSVTYSTLFRQGQRSWYYLDGDGDITLTTPVHNPIPPAIPRLYYTYTFTNEQSFPVATEFIDELPDGVIWDASYSAVTTNGLEVNLVYTNDNKDVAINPLILPPGTSTLTLATTDVTAGGTIENSASLTIAGSSVLIEPSGGAAVIELPGITPLPQFANSAVSTFGLVATDKSFELKDANAGILGKVAVTDGVIQSHVAGGVTAEYMVHPPNVGGVGGLDTQPGSGGSAVVPTYVDLSAIHQEALDLSAEASGMPTTQSFGTISSSTTIDGGAPDGINVISVANFDMSGSATLTLNGNDSDYFVINIGDKCLFKDQSRILLSGGVTASQVIVNMPPGSSDVVLTNQAQLTGLFFAVQDTNKFEILDDVVVTGSVSAREVIIDKQAQIVHNQFQ